MKLKRFNFIDFEPVNILTKRVWLVILMAPLIFMVYNVMIGLCTVLFSVIYAMCSPDAPKAFFNGDAVRLFSLFTTSMGILVALAYVRFAEKRKLTTIGLTKQNILPQFGVGALLGIAMISIPIAILLLFNGGITINPAINNNLLILYFLGFIIQGAAEEFLIRGYFFTSLYKSSNIFWAVTISSLFFALLHLLGPVMGVLPFINIFLFGVFACFIFLRTKNIWAIAALHAMWNFFQGNLYGFQVSGQIYREYMFYIKSSLPKILTGGDFGIEGGLLATAVIIIATVITIFCGKNKLIVNDKKTELDK